MKKILSLLLLVTCCSFSYAHTLDTNVAYTGSSDFNRLEMQATAALALHTFVGLQAKWVDEKAFKKDIYSVALPIDFDFNLIQFNLRPFYYFKNKSDNPLFQDSLAYGMNSSMSIFLQSDEVNDLYTKAVLGVSFARQKGTLFTKEDLAENRYYSQLAYSVGFQQNYYRAFGFEVSASAFGYPDGVSHATGFRGIMDQQELAASTQNFDIVHNLTKYIVGGRFTRMWADNNSSLYVGYQYSEHHAAQDEHSALFGNTFWVANRVQVDMAYNHVFDVHNRHRRDIFYIRLGTSF